MPPAQPEGVAPEVIPGVSVRFVGSEKGPKRTVPGPFQLVAEYTFEEIPHPDVILVPYDQSSMGDERTLAWLRSAHETARWTTSVCAGAITLAAAGLLAGRRATTHWMTRGLLGAFGATTCPSGGSRTATSSPPPATRPESTWPCS